MSDRPDKPNDKVNDGDGRGLSASVQNQVFEDMIAQSKENSKWRTPSNTSTDASSAEQAGAAQGATANKTATDALAATGGAKVDQRGSDGGSMLVATSRSSEDLVTGPREHNDNAAKAAIEQAKSLGINVTRDQVAPAGDKVHDGNSIVIPILNEFIRDGVKALQERPPVTVAETMAAVNTEIQRRQQVDATIVENQKQNIETQKPGQQPELQSGTDAQRQQTPEATRDQARETQSQKQTEAIVKEANENKSTEANLATKPDAIQAANDQAASRVTENISARGTEINRTPIEVGATTDLQSSANARGTKGATETAAGEGEKPSNVRDTTRGAVDTATADSRAAAQAIADGNAAPELEQKADVKESGKAKETTEDGERKGIAAVAKAIADFAKKVIDMLLGKGGESDEKGDGKDSEESASESESESEDDRQKKIQEEKRPTYIVMEGDYLELVCTKLYASSAFAPLLKTLNPKMTVIRQYLAVYQRDVDMLKTGEELLLPTKTEIEEFLRTQ